MIPRLTCFSAFATGWEIPMDVAAQQRNSQRDQTERCRAVSIREWG
jgi:hypothetical protein